MGNESMESKLTISIDRFRAVLNSEPNVQGKLHDIMMFLQQDVCLSSEEVALTVKTINSFLSISFLIKENEK